MKGGLSFNFSSFSFSPGNLSDMNSPRERNSTPIPKGGFPSLQMERFRMKKTTIRLSVLSILAVFAAARAELVRNPTAVGASLDFGQITKGSIYIAKDRQVSGRNPAEDSLYDNQPITRTGVYLTESGTYNERLTIKLTLGGLFWYALPYSPNFLWRRTQFGPGVGEAQGLYAFGSDPKNPVAKLQFGLFPHKYSDAVNLGEYLYRSGTYPGTLVTGGWSYINSAAYMAQGIRLTVPLLGGMISNDVTFYMERDLEPQNDISPGYVLTVKPVPFLEFGAGAVWAHAISMNSDNLTPHFDNNKYSKATKRPYSIATADTCPCG